MYVILLFRINDSSDVPGIYADVGHETLGKLDLTRCSGTNRWGLEANAPSRIQKQIPLKYVTERTALTGR